MDQQASTPPSLPAADATSLSLQVCPRTRIASVGAEFIDRSQICPDLAPAPVSLIDGLRAKVRAIERPSITIDPTVGHHLESAWTLGIPHLDTALSGGVAPLGLDCAGIHEVKPVTARNASAIASWGVSIGFALRLAVRRLEALQSVSAAPALIVWCWPKALANELGHLHAAGLAGLGLNPARLLFVETGRASQTLWAIEEALKSGACALVMSALDAVDLVEARRLSLAAQAQATPCLLITNGSGAHAAAVASRWRIGLHPSPPHPLDARLPGGFAATVAIERCRRNPTLSQSVPFALEWCDEAHRFRLPAPLAHRAPDARTFRSAAITASLPSPPKRKAV